MDSGFRAARGPGMTKGGSEWGAASKASERLFLPVLNEMRGAAVEAAAAARFLREKGAAAAAAFFRREAAALFIIAGKGRKDDAAAPGGGARNSARGAILDPQRRGKFAQAGVEIEPIREIATSMMTGCAVLLADVGDMRTAARFCRPVGGLLYRAGGGCIGLFHDDHHKAADKV
jgi:hypothetical protein